MTTADDRMSWATLYIRLRQDANDSEAWGALQDGVRRWAQAALWQRGWHVVEDAVADTCSTVVVNIDRARGPETFSGFAYGHYLNVRRRLIGAQHDDASLDADDVPASDDIETGPDDREIGLLKLCLSELPERERTAVDLRYWKEAPSNQLAETLGVTATNARQLLFRALAKLRRCVEREWDLIRNTTPIALPRLSEGQR